MFNYKNMVSKLFSLLIFSLFISPQINPSTANARGGVRIPDITVQVGQEFYITASRISKRKAEYYGYGGVSFFSADPGYVFGADGYGYSFDVELDGTIIPSGSSTYTAPMTPGEYQIDLFWWSPEPPYDDLIYIGSAKVSVTP